MEGERGEVAHASDHFVVPLGTEGMGGIIHHNHVADGFLQFVGRLEQTFLAFHDSLNPGIVAGHASQVHRDNYLRLLVDGVGQFLIIHLIRVRLSIYQHQLGTHVTDGAGRCRIGIGRCDYLVAGTDV